MKAKIVIVGGGVMGVSIAMHAARNTDPLREPVVLLERRSLAAGSSGRSGAVLRQYYSSPVLAAMARDSLRVYAGFGRQTGRSIGFQRTGVLTLARSTGRGDVDELRQNVEMQAALGIETRCVEAPEIRRIVPGIAVDDRAVGAFEPGGGFVDPQLTVEALAAVARTYGAVIRPGREVQEFLFQRGRIAGVETEEERIECEAVVVAAGPWTPRLLARHGIRLPLSVRRTRQHFVATPGGQASGALHEALESGDLESSGATEWILGGMALGARIDRELKERLSPTADVGRAAHPVLLDQELGFYARCEPRHGRTRVGRLDHEGEPLVEDPDRYPDELDARFRASARADLERRMPVYRELADRDSEAALYTMSPDEQALIGPVGPRAGVYVVSGFSGHGFKLAPSVGEGVAQMLAGAPVSAFDPEFFSPARFAGHASAAPARSFGL